jgi:hypothetical protein
MGSLKRPEAPERLHELLKAAQASGNAAFAIGPFTGGILRP